MKRYIYIYIFICMYICTRHFPARNRTRRISSADHREQIRYIRSSFVECGYKFGAEERERERKQNKRKKYLSSTDDWTKTAAKRKKTTTGLGFRSSRNGSAIPLFGASLEISRTRAEKMKPISWPCHHGALHGVLHIAYRASVYMRLERIYSFHPCIAWTVIAPNLKTRETTRFFVT